MRVVARYRNSKYPIYAWADHIYTVMTMATLLLAIALLVASNPHWSDFGVVFLVAFIGGAIHGRIETNWILEWMNDEVQTSPPIQ
jgi:preprotein translocase subunit SecF